jgi:hypothetical protein
MGIINEKYNHYKNIKQARFAYFECFDDKNIAKELLNEVEIWAKENDMDHLIGPYGFSDKDPQGFLIKGFEHMPILVSASNFPYMIPIVENYGFKKEIDCLVYKYDLDKELPDIYHKIHHRLQNTDKFVLHEFKSKNQLRPFIIPVLTMMNSAYKEIYGFVPLDEKEKKELANRYYPILNPHFVKIITCKGEVVAFLVGIPNLTHGIQRARGRLFPFGIFKIIIDSKRTRQLDLMLGAIKEGFRGRGLDVLLGTSIVRSAKELNFKTIEIHLMLETNLKILAEMEKAEATLHKRFRVYRKEL